MGYYSHVVIDLEDEARKKVIKELAEKNKESLDLLLSGESRVLRGHTLYEWDEIKWYYAFDDIKGLVDTVEKLDPKEYFYIQVGEEPGDVYCSGGEGESPFAIRHVSTIEIIEIEE